MRRSVALVFLFLAVALAGTADAEMTVDEAVVCTSVADRRPEGVATSFPADVGTVFAFTKVVGGGEGSSVTHRWIRGDRTVAEVRLDVKGSPWRVWSSKKIAPAWSGPWKVEVLDDAGGVLKTVEFAVGGEAPAKAPAAPAGSGTPGGGKSAK
ncbi:MAG: DUF2914 domain-containing protein [Gemmatimonadota bacterium]